MNDYSKNKIAELNAEPLIKSKEWGRRSFKKLEGRQVYWTWTQKIHTFRHICPMTLRVWFTQNFNGWASDTNAITEMYLIPKNINNENKN